MLPTAFTMITLPVSLAAPPFTLLDASRIGDGSRPWSRCGSDVHRRRLRRPNPPTTRRTRPPRSRPLQLDPRAFAPLYAAYADPVYRYCLRCLGDREDAAEATQEVFARRCGAAALPRPGLPPLALHHRPQRHRRRLPPARQPSTGGAAGGGGRAGGPGAGSEEAALAAEAQRSVHRYLAQLPPDQRAVVELRLADLTGKEVAAVLSRSLGSVKIAQHRAFARLRDLLCSKSARRGGMIFASRDPHDRFDAYLDALAAPRGRAGTPSLRPVTPTPPSPRRSAACASSTPLGAPTPPLPPTSGRSS